MRSVLVTGGNQGIGFALCKQLAIDYNCHVFLTARNPERGQAAADKISEAIGSTPSCTGSVDFIPLDTSNDDSVAKAAAATKQKLSSDGKLYGIVNNAGIGLNTANSGDIISTNLYGPKRIIDNFLSMLDEDNGRIVNLGSGSGPMYVRGCSDEDKKILCSPETVTFDFIESHWKRKINGSDVNVYGLSKALLACYTGILARDYPNILSSCVSPGFIGTQMTEGFGASKTPAEGTVPIRHCLFEELDGNGWYYGSDAVRSPYHFLRNPGEPTYDGTNPFV
jgi:NAD(P)-dependent dehydrogenase (short-subunit alcohol dehydrogenase family)|eukprot:scaffold10251_cov287-Chaetoceros_neogracile.AAC.2